jgi:hypothetical protein
MIRASGGCSVDGDRQGGSSDAGRYPLRHEPLAGYFRSHSAPDDDLISGFWIETSRRQLLGRRWQRPAAELAPLIVGRPSGSTADGSGARYRSSLGENRLLETKMRLVLSLDRPLLAGCLPPVRPPPNLERSQDRP